MAVWITWINQNQALFSLAFSFVVMLSTVIYACLTWRMMHETVQLRKAQTEPKVAVYFEQSNAGIHFLDLVIKNVGLGVAYNVRVKVLEEFPVRDGKKLTDIEFIRDGINYMPPNYSLRSFILSFLEGYDKIIDKKLRMEVAYENSGKAKISEVITLNMSQFKGIQSLGEDPLKKIAKSIESMAKEIGHLSSGFHHLRVDTYTAKDREEVAVNLEKQREAILKKTSQNEKK